MTSLFDAERDLSPSPDPAWIIDELGYDPLREASRQSRFAISNGFLGVRGARALTRGGEWGPPPRTYVAGLFDTDGATPPMAILAPAADWLEARLWGDGAPLALDPCDLASHRATLDLKRGVLLTDCRQQSSQGLGVRLRTLRLVSLKDRSLGLQVILLNVERGAAEITFECDFEGLDRGLASVRREQDLGVWRTRHADKTLAMAATTRLWVDGVPLEGEALGCFRWRWRWPGAAGQSVRFERQVSIVRGRTSGADPAEACGAGLAAAGTIGAQGVVADHQAAWTARWDLSDVAVGGDSEAQKALRFAGYHLNGAANPDDREVSIGARALTGDDYRGHVFWDTEIFLLPFYTLTWPAAARSLLAYRYHTLDAARARARDMGWRGALYAWESADTGADVTPRQVVGPDRKIVEILTGPLEQHISADIAYAVWQYWIASGDEAHLRDEGAEILLETARFWASRAVLEADGRHHIRGVIGPDEYHPAVDDNAFTNGMARWNLRRGGEVARLLEDCWPDVWSGLAARLRIDADEIERWAAVADTLISGLDPVTGLYDQFAGFGALEAIDLTAYSGRSAPMDVVLGRERTARAQVIKQADVVALMALLPDDLPTEYRAMNFAYYSARCSHGSSLSHALHGVVAARLGQVEIALDHFRKTAAIDLGDDHAAIAGGVHIAALGGLWMMAVVGFGGLSVTEGGLRLDPHLPGGWTTLSFKVQWRGRLIGFDIDMALNRIEARLISGERMELTVRRAVCVLEPAVTLRVDGQARVAADLTGAGGQFRRL